MLTSVRTALVNDVKVESWGTDGSRALVFGGNGPLDDAGAVYVVMQSPEDCDKVIRAAAEAKRLLSGEQPSWCTATTDIDGETLYCDRDPGHDGSHHAPGPDEGSEVAWGDPCDATCPVPGLPYACTLTGGHSGPHEAWGTDDDEPIVVWPFTPPDDRLAVLHATVAGLALGDEDAELDHIAIEGTRS